MEIQDNVSKAREIAHTHKIEYIKGLKDERGTSFIECVGSALQMAQWKDQQFKEYLEKKKESMIKKWGHIVAAGVSAIDMIINELFPEPKEQDNSERED